MKVLSKFATALLIVLVFQQNVMAQIKVFPQNKVQIGPLWWSTFPSIRQLFINGDMEINCYPATSGLGFNNYHNLYNNVWYDEPILEPQWNHSAWLGNPTKAYWRTYTRELYTLTGGVYSYSDSRLKTNILPITGETALRKVMAIKSYSFDYSTEMFSTIADDRKREAAINESKNQIGFMAQELKEILPQAVKQDETTGWYSVNYIMLIPVLVEAIKTQQEKIDLLEQQLNELKK